MYFLGETVTEGYKQSVYRYNNGNEPTEGSVGWAIVCHSKMNKDFEQASSWYLKAAKQGYVLTKYQFGLIYQDDLGVSENLSLSYAWLSIASLNGLQEAEIRRSSLYSKISKEQLSSAMNTSIDLINELKSSK